MFDKEFDLHRYTENENQFNFLLDCFDVCMNIFCNKVNEDELSASFFKYIQFIGIKECEVKNSNYDNDKYDIKATKALRDKYITSIINNFQEIGRDPDELAKIMLPFLKYIQDSKVHIGQDKEFDIENI